MSYLSQKMRINRYRAVVANDKQTNNDDNIVHLIVANKRGILLIKYSYFQIILNRYRTKMLSR